MGDQVNEYVETDLDVAGYSDAGAGSHGVAQEISFKGMC